MSTTVYKNFRLFSGLHASLEEDKILVVQDGEIIAVEPASALGRYDGLDVVDLKGFTLLPGLIDAHVQIGIPFIRRINFKTVLDFPRQLHNNLRWVLHSGVTTVRDMAGIPGVLQKMRREVRSGKVPGPRILCANSFITCPSGYPDMAPTFNPIQKALLGGQFAERVSTPDEARDCVRRMVDLEADWIKTGYSEHSYFAGRGELPRLTEDCYRAVVDEAHRLGRPVALHQTSLAGFKKGVDLGVQTLEHMPGEGPLEEAWIEEVLEKDIAIVPTLYVPHAYLDLDAADAFLEGPGRAYFAPEPYRQTRYLLNQLQKGHHDHAALEKDCLIDICALKGVLDDATIYNNVKRLHEAGVTIGCGSDGGGELIFFGRLHEEIKLLAKAGLSNFEALQTATINNAKIIRMADRLGTIEVGKIADFVTVEGNPLEDLDALTQVRVVVKDGKIEFYEKQVEEAKKVALA